MNKADGIFRKSWAGWLVFWLFACGAVACIVATLVYTRLEHRNSSPNYSDLAAAYAGLMGGCATLATLLYVIFAQQKLVQGSLLIQAATARVEAHRQRISDAKAVLDTMRRGAKVPFSEQNFGSDPEAFARLRESFEQLLSNEEDYKKAEREIGIWEDAVNSRDRALRILESQGS